VKNHSTDSPFDEIPTKPHVSNWCWWWSYDVTTEPEFCCCNTRTIGHRLTHEYA